MELNRALLLFLFGISLLPKIYSDIYPSLIIKKTYKNYAAADEIQHIEDQNDTLIFSTSPQYQLYYACPEENAPHHLPDALKVQEPATDIEARPLQQFFQGDFIKYNCPNLMKPIALEYKKNFKNILEAEYHIGFLIHGNTSDFGRLWKKYKNVPRVPEYDFIPFLTITMDKPIGSIISVRHRIISGGFLEQHSPLDPLPSNEKNIDIYGFDVDSLYTEENQQKMFSMIFGESYSRYYDHQEDRYLIKVQLAPYEDFLLNTWKLPAFTDLNTTGMWKKLHNQWSKIELFVRKVARYLHPLTVETGATKTLALAHDNKETRSVYLRDQRNSPVAKYFWKLVTFQQSEDDDYTQAILIIMHNDPYTENQKPICEDVGETFGWMVSNEDYKTGLTYVCSVYEKITTQLHDEFKRIYPSFDVSDLQKREYDENDMSPSLFVLKTPDTFYTLADQFVSVEGQDNVFKFSTPPGYRLYNACPEENAYFYRKYTLKVQELVTDFEASWEELVYGDFDKYNCRNPIKPTVLKCKEDFEDDSVLELDIGFLVHDKDANFEKLSEKYENFTEIQEYVFLHFLTVRMNKRSRIIMEVLHQIISRGLLEPELTYPGTLPLNEKNIDIYGFDINSLYTEENQAKIFSSIFPERHSLYYSYPNQSLRKVQLAPHKDFQLNTWKLASLMDLNTTAIWEQLHSQWKNIEIFVRKVAQEMEPLTIETGTARTLSLADVKNHQKPVYLGENKTYPVSMIVWKLVKFVQLNNDGYTQAILIVMHNDPYTPDQKPICEDVSENWGWMVSNKDYKTGLTYGCEVTENVMRELHELYDDVNFAHFNLKSVRFVTWSTKDIYSKVVSRP